MSDSDLRRALGFIVPYWRRLALVLALSALSTALSLYLPLLSRDFFDRALIGRDLGTLVRVVSLFAAVSVASFVVNVVSGMRYTRVSADILFDMRLELYRHLQRLSPRFYVRTRMGDIMSRINNDVGEIQRIAAETALAWVGNVLFLAGTIAMLACLDVRLFVLTVATTPFGIWALVRYRTLLPAAAAGADGHVREPRDRSGLPVQGRADSRRPGRRHRSGRRGRSAVGPGRRRIRRGHRIVRPRRAGAGAILVLRARRRDACHRRPERQRKVHDCGSAAAAHRSGRRRRAPRRSRSPNGAARRSSPPRGAGRAGAVHPARDDRREHPIRASRRVGRRGA